MAKGDGSVTEIKRPDGKSYSPKHWRVCISYSAYEAIQGETCKRRKKVQRNVIGTLRDARKVRDAIRRELECGIKPEADTVTFAEFAGRWKEMREQSGDLGRSTIEDMARILDRCTTYIGPLRLKDIGADVIESLYSALRKEAEASGRTLSNSRLSKFHNILSQVFKKAQDYDLVLRNPCDRVKAPRPEASKRKSLTAEEVAIFSRHVNDTEARYYRDYIEKEDRQARRGNGVGRVSIRSLSRLSHVLAVRVGLATGMRRGEVLALDWGAVDLEDGIIDVHRSLTAHGEIKCTKSGRDRSVAIDAATVAHLRAWRGFQERELLKLGVAQCDDTPVCCSEIGQWCQTNNFERWWRQFRKDAGFPELRFHELRHTQATQLLANGVDVKTVQERLGHANASITLDWYAHALPENDRKAANLMGDLLSAEGAEPRIIKLKSA